MKTHLKQIMLMLTLVFTFASCSSDNDDKISGGSRDVKYEVTGNFSGPLTAVYIEKLGNATSEEITKLPWTKEFTADASTQGVTVSAMGSGGVAGQQITVKMFVGGKVVNQLTGTASSNGGIDATLTAYVFPR